MTVSNSSITGLSIDTRSLDALRGDATRNPQAAVRGAAVQFEALFMQMVLKSMRDTVPKTEDQGPGLENFTSMLDTQLARQFSGQPGGLADMVQRQLSRTMPNMPAAAPATGAPPLSDQATTKLSLPKSSSQQEFLERMAPHARAAERATGVPASFILGQAALESGWGRAEIRNADGSSSFNLFGVKAGASWAGATTDVKTTEYSDGQPVKQNARFRSYGSYAEAFADYARLLAGSARYGEVVRKATSPAAFAQGLQRAGYATDPAYASKLTRTINLALAVQRSMA